jgi:hypothetical protein
MNVLDYQNTRFIMDFKEMSRFLSREKAAKTVTARGDSYPPEDLALYISLINLEQLYERELPDYSALDQAEVGRSSRSAMVKWEPWARVNAHLASTLSPETRSFLGPPEDVPHFRERFETLRSAQILLRSIAARNALIWRSVESLAVAGYDKSFRASVPFPEVRVHLVVNEDNEFAVSESPLLEAIVGVSVDRIRSCAICGRIFWAPRINSECCQEKCRKTYNQQNSRKNRKQAAKSKPKTKGR